MNYLQEILAFKDYRLINKLSTGQIALWFALMDTENMSGWAEWFTVSNRTLESLTGLSREGIAKARNALKQRGLIDFKSNGTKASSYKMIPMSKDELTIQDSWQRSTQNSTQRSTQDSTQNRTTLNKRNKKKRNKNNNIYACAREGKACDVFSCYEENIGIIGAAVYECVEEYRRNGLEDALICEAIKDAAINNKRSWKYIDRILADKQNKGIFTLAEYIAEREEWERHRVGNKIQADNELQAYRDVSDFIDEEWGYK